MTANLDTSPIKRQLNRVSWFALAVALMVGFVCCLAAFTWPEMVVQAYLPAFLLVWGTSVGCLALTLIDGLTGGRWGLFAAPFLQAGIRLMPLVALLFLPIALGIRQLYPWTESGYWSGEELANHRRIYYTETWFLIRATLYLGLWNALAWKMIQPARNAAVAGLGLMLLLWSTTFAVNDWVMSLDPHFVSTVFGIMVGTSGLLTAMATVCLAATLIPETILLRSHQSPQTRVDLGNLLMAFVLLWTYLAFSQWLIIWSANLPDEIAWYLRRTTGGWQWLVPPLICGSFVIPFAALLSRSLKQRQSGRLALIASLVICSRYLGLCWEVLPEFSPGRFVFNPFTFLTPIAVGGLWLFAFCRALSYELRRSGAFALTSQEPV